MLKEAVYQTGDDAIRVRLERQDVLLKSEEVLNFPRIIPLADGMMILPYGRGRHGGKESRPVAISRDGGATFADLPADSPWSDNVQTSGILGQLRDGSVAYVDVFPLEVTGWTRERGPYHQAAQVANPSWRLRRFSPTGELVESTTTTVRGLPWERASYENYGTIVELPDGDWLTAFQFHAVQDPFVSYRFSTFIARSRDHGRTFEHVHTFPTELDGQPIGDQGLCEPDTALLKNGDLLCIMRSGGRSPMYQSRSTDGGRTWSPPENVGWPGVKPDLTVLSGGILACSAGRGAYGHPQVTHAMFSLDGTGRVWEAPFVFHTGPGCSYTSSLERDGKLHVVYSDSSFTRPVDAYEMPFQSIKRAAIDVSRERR